MAEPDEDVRYEAVRAAEGDTGATVRDTLLKATQDQSGMVRKVAVRGLARLNDPRDTDLLVNALTDTDEDVRYEAIHALEDRLAPELREPLLAAIRDSDAFVRRIALRAVAQLADPRDTGMLAQALDDSDEDMRYEAVRALENRLDPEVREPLLRAAKDTASDVRSAAVRALGALAAQTGDDTSAGTAPPPATAKESRPTSRLSDTDPADLVLALQVSANHGAMGVPVRDLLAVFHRERLTQAARDDLDHTLYDAGLHCDPDVDGLELNGLARLTRHEVIPEFELRAHVEHSGPWTLPVADLLRAFDRTKLTGRARTDIAGALEYSGLACDPSIQIVEWDDSITLSRAATPHARP
ncbi:MAG TPA: HEAT repeat domain-containing protein [Solirubrobacteraceae bacterium]|nr:HEAT repeat domain-containing protein [Solirubrobacteraceae bacterium]